MSQMSIMSTEDKQQEETNPPIEATTDDSVAPQPISEEIEAAGEPVQGEAAKALAEIVAGIEKETDPEVKIQTALHYMEKALAQTGAPHFKSFWEVRRLAMSLFKENLSPSTRSRLWTRYTELSDEGRRLKEILDEQAAFAVEQIEIAVKALEDDIENFATQLERVPPIAFPAPSKSLERRFDVYNALQRELNLLNTHASRINALRKELIKTEMRVRHKNKFFQRLSAAGDKVFPRRKELIKDVSQHFIDDVDAFIAAHFKEEALDDSLFFAREEIKALQSIAKSLTLNTHSFTHTRTRLSEAWDKVKRLEKDRKRERLKKKAEYKENAQQISNQIQAFKEAFGKGEVSVNDAKKKLDDIVEQLRKVDLGREELSDLRDELRDARQPVLDKIRVDEQSRHDQERERERSRRQRIDELLARAEALVNDVEGLDADQIINERDAILKEAHSSQIAKTERLEIERRFKSLRDVIADKKDKALLLLSSDDQQALQQLRAVLKERLNRRAEIRSQLESFRKAAGASGLDFEQAMHFNEQQQFEKERLDKANEGISEIEEKIAELEDKA